MVRTHTFRHEAKLNFFKQVSRLSNFSLSMANQHQRWMCYQMASGKLINSPLECEPAQRGTGISLVRNELKNIQENLRHLIPELSLDCQVFKPKWIKHNGILCKSNNVYLITGFDGLDPVFSRLDDLLVVGGNLVVFNL